MDLSAIVGRALYRTGEATPVDVLEAAPPQITRVNPVLNAVAAIDGPRARAAAEASARRWAAQRPLPPLEGIPGPLGIRVPGRLFDDQRALRATRGWVERRPFPVARPVTVQAEAAR